MSEESKSSSSSAGSVDVVWAVGAGGDVSLLLGVAERDVAIRDAVAVVRSGLGWIGRSWTVRCFVAAGGCWWWCSISLRVWVRYSSLSGSDRRGDRW